MSQPPDGSRPFNSSKRDSSTQNLPSPPDNGAKRTRILPSSIPVARNDDKELVDDETENFVREMQQRDELVKERMGNVDIRKQFVIPHIPPRNIDSLHVPQRPERPITPTIPTTLYNPITGTHIPFTSPTHTAPASTRPLPKPTIPLPKPAVTIPVEKKSYSNSSYTWKNKIEADTWEDLVSKHGEKDAQAIVEKLYAKHGKKLTSAETIHIFNNCDVNASNAEKFQREFRQHHIPSPFAPRNKIDEERKKMHHDAEFQTKNVKMKPDAKKPPKEVPVTSAKNVRKLIRKRMNNICKNRKYRKILNKNQEELWFAITCDKGKDSTKLGIQFANTKKAVNSAKNIMLIALYNGDDSQENLYAAFNEIVKQLREIKDLTFTGEDGEEKTLPIRWFLIGDYKFLKAVAGLLSGRCKHPCVCCLSETTETYASVDRTKASTPRTENPNSQNSQPRLPLFDFIPFSQYIPPSLHITMGPGADLFDELFERACVLDADDPSELLEYIKKNPQYKKDVRSQCEDLEFLNKELSDAKELENLYFNLFNDIEDDNDELECCLLGDNCTVYLLQKNIPSNENTYCEKCSNFFHNCCADANNSCPICMPFHPSTDSANTKLQQEYQEIQSYIEVIKSDMSNVKLELQKTAQKFKSGKVTKDLEKLLSHCGGSRQAFFQTYTGRHLVNMGNKIGYIQEHLPEAMKNDQKSNDICKAIEYFFEAKNSMSKDLDMSDADIDKLDEDIQKFADFMKEKLGYMRPKQKGHLFLFHVVQFARLFKTSRFFTDEAIECYCTTNNIKD